MCACVRVFVCVCDTRPDMIEVISLQVIINRDSCTLQVWDTAGAERMLSMGAAFYRDAAAYILVYDITRRATLTLLDHWLDEVKSQGLPARTPILVLVGNKCDLAEIQIQIQIQNILVTQVKPATSC